MTSAAIEAAKQEGRFVTAILRIVGERQLGHRPIEEITTRDVEAMARECMKTLPKRRPLDGAPPGPKPSSVRVRPSEARDRSSVPPAPLVSTGGCECVCGHASIGWRFYVADGWPPVCVRHMTGAGSKVRSYDEGQQAGFGPDGVGAGPAYPPAALGAVESP